MSSRAAVSRAQPAKPIARDLSYIGLTGREVPASQHVAHAREQLARVERLREVIVGADLEADDAVHLVALAGQHNDRHLTGGTQLAADGEAVFSTRQHHIQHHEVHPLHRHQAAQAAAVGHGSDAEAMLLEKLREQAADFPIVIDDDDVSTSSWDDSQGPGSVAHAPQE